MRRQALRLGLASRGFVASGMALAGMAEFDAASGAFDLAPFNLYAAVGAVGGVVSSGLAALALWRGWGRR